MSEIAITLKEAKRRMPWLVKQLASHDSVVVTKDGEPFYRVTSQSAKSCTVKELLAVLQKHQLPAKEAAAWNRDLKKARESLSPPENQWD